MAATDADRGGRYWAFVSYSHKDTAFGRRLHRRLESYALPSRLVGRKTAEGAVPRRLHPIFRDREEFAAAGDLSAEVRTALAASRSLIVVCSPAAAASLWVKREVELFRVLHPDRPVLAAICEGEPGQSLPDALRRTGADGIAIEPLAADFRRGRDGAQLGLLKLVAGVVGVGLDELVQRDSHRRLQRVTAVTAVAVVAALGMGALTLFALNAQAERQRSKAEGLVRFMYTDLRDGLRGVGRLDLMAAVNTRALQYYDREIGKLPPTSLAQRAHVLQAIGEDEETRDHPDVALREFEEAWRTTSALLTATPDDPDRIFDHAQSEYWLGFDEYGRGHFAAARQKFEAYRRLAERLVAIDPKNPRYTREVAYAEGDLCSVALKPPKDPDKALNLCWSALTHMEKAAKGLPRSSAPGADLANRQSWLASAYRAKHDEPNELLHLLSEERLLEDVMKADPLNMYRRSTWIALQRLLARIDSGAGHKDSAKARLIGASKLLDEMIQLDPDNRTWFAQRRKIDTEISQVNSNSPNGSQP